MPSSLRPSPGRTATSPSGFAGKRTNRARPIYKRRPRSEPVAALGPVVSVACLAHAGDGVYGECVNAPSPARHGRDRRNYCLKSRASISDEPEHGASRPAEGIAPLYQSVTMAHENRMGMTGASGGGSVVWAAIFAAVLLCRSFVTGSEAVLCPCSRVARRTDLCAIRGVCKVPVKCLQRVGGLWRRVACKSAGLVCVHPRRCRAK